jgi:hypothetical protein
MTTEVLHRDQELFISSSQCVLTISFRFKLLHHCGSSSLVLSGAELRPDSHQDPFLRSWISCRCRVQRGVRHVDRMAETVRGGGACAVCADAAVIMLASLRDAQKMEDTYDLLLGSPAVSCVRTFTGVMGSTEVGVEVLRRLVAMTAKMRTAARYECKLCIGTLWMMGTKNWIQLPFICSAETETEGTWTELGR